MIRKREGTWSFPTHSTYICSENKEGEGTKWKQAEYEDFILKKRQFAPRVDRVKLVRVFSFCLILLLFSPLLFLLSTSLLPFSPLITQDDMLEDVIDLKAKEKGAIALH